MSTIASISTAPGIGGIGIIRMSGKDTFNILEKIFVQKNKKDIEEIPGYTIKYGHIEDDGKIIDEVLVSYFKAPKSYTSEDMCEINSHGGNVIMKKILELCIRNGAEVAEPGEFTKRAFLNGRIDLAQAESVIDIINAKSDREAKEGIKQLNGFLSREIGDIKKDLMNVITNIEVSIDYPEYDTPEESNDDIMENIVKTKNRLEILKGSFDNGKIIKQGIKTVIIGKPNAGKSSLLNAILKEDRAIVTEYEGTTRDTIEEFVNINGVPLVLVDTAGIRDAKDEVEKIGIEKSRKLAQDADLIIAIIDSSNDLTEEDLEILEIAKSKKSIIVLNKMDLDKKIDSKNENIKHFENIITISAMQKQGLEKLYSKIGDLFSLNQINFDNEVLITNERHKNLISKAIDNLEEAKKSLEGNMPVDIICISLRNVLSNLGSITGEEAGEEIINEIFARFCLGK
ncbi:MAG: tRNA uridine-5-carboxymethylaminomethyl(34) synthesis GTPase MnmE [Clostridia bacterium]|nr:tRNA uridine-5-carboxymethylaminomethyl(34) synthesis GTPase MnmE [Clostridia bacterium]